MYDVRHGQPELVPLLAGHLHGVGEEILFSEQVVELHPSVPPCEGEHYREADGHRDGVDKINAEYVDMGVDWIGTLLLLLELGHLVLVVRVGEVDRLAVLLVRLVLAVDVAVAPGKDVDALPIRAGELGAQGAGGDGDCQVRGGGADAAHGVVVPPLVATEGGHR